MKLYQDLREDWNFKAEDSEIVVPQQVKEESEDDYWFESQPEQQSSSITSFEVRKNISNSKKVINSSFPVLNKNFSLFNMLVTVCEAQQAFYCKNCFRMW